MRFSRKVMATLLAFSVIAYTQGNDFNRVRYNGGTIQTKVNPKDWDNHLVVTSERVTLKLKDGQETSFSTKNVTSLSYGQEAHRRVGTMIALGILVAPLALFGLFHKTRLHFVGIEYTTDDGKRAGLLLQGDKNNYRGMLVALTSATGAPLIVSEKDREYVPVGVEATFTKGGDNDKAAAAGSVGEVATVSLLSTPEGAEVYIDGAFHGNAPATLKLVPGKHNVRVTATGYREWVRELTVGAGSELRLSANLEKL
jgi:PEGA domain